MNERKFVQYKNDPNGKKWEVHEELSDRYDVFLGGKYFVFPKSDYIPCAPPERWTDVTADCRLTEGTWPYPDGTANAIQQDSYILWRASSHASGYRMRKVLVQMEGRAGTAWAFIVEKRED